MDFFKYHITFQSFIYFLPNNNIMQHSPCKKVSGVPKQLMLCGHQSVLMPNAMLYYLVLLWS